MDLVFLFPCAHSSYLDAAAGGSGGNSVCRVCIGGNLWLGLLMLPLCWGSLMCTLPDGASPVALPDSWACLELHYCLGSEVLGSPKATVKAVGPRQYLHFLHHQARGQTVVRSQVVTLASLCCCRSSERRELQPPGDSLAACDYLLAPVLPFLHSPLTTASRGACFP